MTQTSAARVASVGEVARVDPKGKTDRQLLLATLRQTEAVHECFETYKVQQNAAAREAAEARRVVAETMLAVQAQVTATAETVGTVQTNQAEDRAQLRLMTLAIGARDPDEGEEAPVVPKANVHFSVTQLLSIAGSIGGGMAFFIFAIQLIGKLAPVAWAYITGLSVT